MSEVSTLPSSSYLNRSSATAIHDPSTSATDPAQLLRQAALTSRKLKRRKLDSNASISSLPRPLPRSIVSTPSIALDYGTEEPSSTTSTEERPPLTTLDPVLPSTPTQSSPLRDTSSGSAPQTSLNDDLSAREEGEISESEDLPSQPPPKSISGVIYHTRAESPGFIQSSFESRSPSVKAEHAYQPATPPSTASRRLSTEPPLVSLKPPLESFRLETPLYVLDAYHVRPGLTCGWISNLHFVPKVLIEFTVTQRQFDTAKEVILDILGYGVPPEYLIDCGLSREIIYYVFTELNLRLPNNLDIVGIPPYPPPPDMIASLLSQSSYPPPSATLGTSRVDDDAVRGSSEQPTLSPRPLASHGMYLSPSSNALILSHMRRRPFCSGGCTSFSRRSNFRFSPRS